jgi:hypothetical protein
MMNKAIVKASYPYIIEIDGDAPFYKGSSFQEATPISMEAV